MAAEILLPGKIENVDGEWLVGDAMPIGHPGRIERDDPRRLMLKVWIAGDSPKYIRTAEHKGWEPPLPAHDGRLEGVQVFTGKFSCQRQPEIYTLAGGRSIELGPYDYRCWFLPQGSLDATGVTICRQTVGKPEEFGAGVGYEYYPFIRPHAFPQWFEMYVPSHEKIQYKLVVVFEGQIQDPYASDVILNSMEYAFFPKAEWALLKITKPHTSFAILYF